MNILSSDPSIFEINNKYPERLRLNPHADILIFDDFLKKPDEYKKFLSGIPAFRSDFFYPTASPGWRQIVTYEYFQQMEGVLSNYTGNREWVQQSFTNIYKSQMPCNSKSWYPHHDSMDYTLNLWLSEGIGGTAFYTWNGHYCGETLSETQKDKIFSNQIPGEFLYQDFTGDDEWKQYHLQPVKYNRAIFYNGNDFHSAYVPDGSFQTDWRYSLVLMGS